MKTINLGLIILALALVLAARLIEVGLVRSSGIKQGMSAQEYFDFNSGVDKLFEKK